MIFKIVRKADTLFILYSLLFFFIIYFSGSAGSPPQIDISLMSDIINKRGCIKPP